MLARRDLGRAVLGRPHVRVAESVPELLDFDDLADADSPDLLARRAIEDHGFHDGDFGDA